MSWQLCPPRGHPPESRSSGQVATAGDRDCAERSTLRSIWIARGNHPCIFPAAACLSTASWSFRLAQELWRVPVSKNHGVSHILLPRAGRSGDRHDKICRSISGGRSRSPAERIGLSCLPSLSGVSIAKTGLGDGRLRKQCRDVVAHRARPAGGSEPIRLDQTKALGGCGCKLSSLARIEISSKYHERMW